MMRAALEIGDNLISIAFELFCFGRVEKNENCLLASPGVSGSYADLGDVRLSIFCVAVVEDDESFRESLEGLFLSVGYEVLPYLSGEDFMRSGRLLDIDCLITDFGLPGMSGIDLLRAAHAIRPDLRVIVVTARMEPSILSDAVAAGAHRAFMKPVASSELLKAITSGK
jgi:FixJ family two-component response regulator